MSFDPLTTGSALFFRVKRWEHGVALQPPLISVTSALASSFVTCASAPHLKLPITYRKLLHSTQGPMVIQKLLSMTSSGNQGLPTHGTQNASGV